MKLLVIGARGQLGLEAVKFFEDSGYDVAGIDREKLDLTAIDRIGPFIESSEVDWVVNCAAYTEVDRAEIEPEQAYAVNRDAAGAIAEAARRCETGLIHVSTDFVFGGGRSTPYPDSAEGDALGVYGQSKWEGEQKVRVAYPGAIILRTAWVYGRYGGNFVRTMLRLMSECTEIRVVDDQVGTPTWTRDIVRAMERLIKVNGSGTYNFSNEGVASWYDLAVATHEIGSILGYPMLVEHIVPIPGSEWVSPAARPAYSVLDKVRIRQVLDYPVPHWRTSLERMLKANLA